MSDDAGQEIERMLSAARATLVGAPQEGLGARQPTRRILGIPRAPRIVRVGSAWHLGALLLTADAVLATGEIVRAREEVRRGFPAESQRLRAETAAAARRGGFAEGEPAHIDWTLIDLASVAGGAGSGPLTLRDGVPSIRWSPTGGFQPLQRYLDERVELLIHPLSGAT